MTLEHIDVVVLDVGGTLVHPVGAQIAAAIETSIGLLVDPRQCQRSFARADVHFDSYGEPPDEATYAKVWGETLDLTEDDASLAWNAVHATDIAGRPLWNDLVQDAAWVLEALAERGYRLAVLSNADGRLFAELTGHGLASHFETIVDSVVVGVSKPHRDAYIIVPQRLAVPAIACCYVGDEPRELRGALDAGYGAVVHCDRFGVYPDSGFPTVREFRTLLHLFAARMSE